MGSLMNKQQFRAAYREARLAACFISAAKTLTGVEVSSMYQTLEQCPGFCFTRLYGDPLKWSLTGILPRDVSYHRRLLRLLGYVQPVLP